MLSGIQVGLENPPGVMYKEVIQYEEMQRSIPKGKKLLTVLEKPFLLDFNRNIIFVADWPGVVSLPPGMTHLKGGEAMADYLISKSIRYIAYAYKSEAGLPRKEFGQWLNPDTHPMIRNLFFHTYQVHDNLEQLAKTRKSIYDDGEIFVLDLSKRR